MGHTITVQEIAEALYESSTAKARAEQPGSTASFAQISEYFKGELMRLARDLMSLVDRAYAEGRRDRLEITEEMLEFAGDALRRHFMDEDYSNLTRWAYEEAAEVAIETALEIASETLEEPEE